MYNDSTTFFSRADKKENPAFISGWFAEAERASTFYSRKRHRLPVYKSLLSHNRREKEGKTDTLSLSYTYIHTHTEATGYRLLIQKRLSAVASFSASKIASFFVAIPGRLGKKRPFSSLHVVRAPPGQGRQGGKRWRVSGGLRRQRREMERVRRQREISKTAPKTKRKERERERKSVCGAGAGPLLREMPLPSRVRPLMPFPSERITLLSGSVNVVCVPSSPRT